MSEYITRSTVKEKYGLTDSMLKELGEPDKIVPNPHYRSGSSMYLYLRERVEQWAAENTERVDKVLKRRKPKTEKDNSELHTQMLQEAKRGMYRQSQRQVGDKWSWSVYDNNKHQLLKTGWASSEDEAKSLCREVIRLASMEFLSGYG